MKQYRKLFFLGFICAAWPVSYAQAQDVSAGVPDSLLTIGYTVGHTRNISSLVESFTGKQPGNASFFHAEHHIYAQFFFAAFQKKLIGIDNQKSQYYRNDNRKRRQQHAELVV